MILNSFAYVPAFLTPLLIARELSGFSSITVLASPSNALTGENQGDPMHRAMIAAAPEIVVARSL